MIVLILTLSNGTASVGALPTRGTTDQFLLYVLFTVSDNGKSPAPCNPKQYEHPKAAKHNNLIFTQVLYLEMQYFRCLLTSMLGISTFVAETLWLASLFPHPSFCCWVNFCLSRCEADCFCALWDGTLLQSFNVFCVLNKAIMTLLKASININRWESMDWSHRLRTGNNSGCYKLGNESADSIKSIEFLDNLNDY